MSAVTDLGKVKDHNQSIHLAYDEYSALGWKCLPLNPGTKATNIKEWTTRKFEKKDFSGMCNIGVQLGAESDMLVDVDIDNPVARKIAHIFLPHTTYTFGRLYEGEGDAVITSHYLYYLKNLTSKGDGWSLLRAEESFKGEKLKIIELRGLAKAEQTCFPPSCHASNIVWTERIGAPAIVDHLELKHAIGIIATIIWASQNTSKGQFHSTMLKVVGGLAKAGVSIDMAKRAVEAICWITGQKDVSDRLHGVDTTYEKLEKGESVAGFNSLREEGWDVSRVLKWLPSKVHESKKVANDSRPKVHAGALTLSSLVEEIFKNLEQVPSEQKNIFNYSGAACVVVRDAITGSSSIIEPGVDALAHHIEKHIQFVKHDANNHVDVVTELSHHAVNRLRDPSLCMGLSTLNGILNHPTFLFTGKLIIDRGYCQQSGLYLSNDLGITKDEILGTSVDEAREIIEDLYTDFPFQNRDYGMSVSATCLISAIAAKSIKMCPAFVLTSPYPSDGKTVWSFIPQLVTSGESGSYSLGTDDEERLKQLTTYLRNDPSAIVFDNQNGYFQSQVLNELLTSGSFKNRLLGTNNQISLSPKTVFIVNGINVRPSPEISTRAVTIAFEKRHNLNPKHPNFVRYVLSKRKDIVRAALKIIAYGMDHGHKIKLNNTSRFEDWDKFVRRAVMSVGYEDPMNAEFRINMIDETEEYKAIMFDDLLAMYPVGVKHMAKEVAGRIGMNTELEKAILHLSRRKEVSSVPIGMAMGRIDGYERWDIKYEFKESRTGVKIGEFKHI